MKTVWGSKCHKKQRKQKTKKKAAEPKSTFSRQIKIHWARPHHKNSPNLTKLNSTTHSHLLLSWHCQCSEIELQQPAFEAGCVFGTVEPSWLAALYRRAVSLRDAKAGSGLGFSLSTVYLGYWGLIVGTSSADLGAYRKDRFSLPSILFRSLMLVGIITDEVLVCDPLALELIFRVKFWLTFAYC